MSGQGPIHIRLAYHVNRYLTQHSKPPESIILSEIQYQELLRDAREKLAADGVGIDSIDKFLDIPIVVRERCIELPGMVVALGQFCPNCSDFTPGKRINVNDDGTCAECGRKVTGDS